MKKRDKRFCIVTLMFVASLVLYNLVVWQFFTKQLLTRDGGVFTGELARMGYLSGYAHPRKNVLDLPRKHLTFGQVQDRQIDVITIGDSFSQGAANGPNRFYQDYIASLNDFNLLNLSPHYPGTRNFIETVVVLLNSGFLDQVRPDYLILERVERNCYKLAGDVNFAKTDSLENVRRFYTENDNNRQQPDLPPVGFLNSGNFKWLTYNLLYPFSPNGFLSKVYRFKMDEPLFSGKKGDSLLFINKDLNKFKKKSKGLGSSTVRAINDNLNRLAQMLREKDIELYFMPAVDKFSLYGPYVLDNPFADSLFFEEMALQPKDYYFINTRKILAEELSRGEKDIFYIDDTHWSWKASKAIFKAVHFK